MNMPNNATHKIEHPALVHFCCEAEDEISTNNTKLVECDAHVHVHVHVTCQFESYGYSMCRNRLCHHTCCTASSYEGASYAWNGTKTVIARSLNVNVDRLNDVTRARASIAIDGLCFVSFC